MELKLNNPYLYNLIFNSEFCNYTKECSCVLGMEPSLALYLFDYSRTLFLTYPREFKTNSLIINSFRFFNTCIYLTKNHCNISNYSFNYKNINFKYIDRYTTNFIHIDSVNGYDKVYQYNPPEKLYYNGIRYFLPKIEDVISYCFYLYGKSFNISYLRDASVLSCIYKNKIINNNILTNLLIVGSNVKKIFNRAIKDFMKLEFSDIAFDFDQAYIRERVQPTLDFCHES